MFAKTIIDSDSFLDMPLSTQVLYFHLSMRADDDGFINNPKKIQRMVGCGDDDLKLLIAKNFIIPFESGIVVIKHWKIHNYIRNDRYKETVYKEEKAMLETKENNVYTIGMSSGIPNGYQMDTQDRIGKDSIGKSSIGEDRIKKETYVSIIEGYTDNPLLVSSLKDYVEMRKKQKAFTTRALTLNLNELSKLTNYDEEKIAIVNQTVMNGWKGFFPLKKPIQIVQTWETPTESKDHVKELIEDYKMCIEAEKLGYDMGDKLKNIVLMYKDLTGKNIEEDVKGE